MTTKLRFARIPAMAFILALAACSGSDTGNAGDTTDSSVADAVAPADVAATDAAEDPSTADTTADEGVVAADVAEESAPADVATDMPTAEVDEIAADTVPAEVDEVAADPVPDEATVADTTPETPAAYASLVCRCRPRPAINAAMTSPTAVRLPLNTTARFDTPITPSSLMR